MVKKHSIADDLSVHCQRILANNGRLSTSIPGFIVREQQTTLCLAIARAITTSSTLVAEAGTGTGKTFAYLLPCLLSGKKALISTATKTLQDQLFYKDLPMLIRALGLSARIQNLKGRANYLCRHRIEWHTNEGRFLSPQCVHDLLHIRDKLPQMKDGERSELPEISEDSLAWPLATSTTDNCLGSECTHHQQCFLIKARKKAMDADLVVINHHLFFADSRLKEEGFGELLPGVDVVVFDEAHQLGDIAVNFNGERFSTRQFQELMDDVLKEWPVLDLANQPLKSLRFEADKRIDKLLMALPHHDERIGWEELEHNILFQKAWQDFLNLIDDLINVIDASGMTENANIHRCAKRLDEFKLLALRFINAEKSCIRWLERFKQSLVCHATPFDISESFKTLVSKKNSAWVFTSATLTMANSFDCFTKPLGLDKADTLLLPSPFDYQQQALLYLPRALPDPNDSDYYIALVAKALPIINAFGGRCFFLFTSHRALKQVAGLLANTLHYPLLIQGDEAKPLLLARFRQLGNAVLLGTATFWEGVDVKGEALSLVIIDKLPFASPVDPVVRGKMAWIKSRGLSGFDELSLPNAVLALKQGVGRLIRDATDKGVLMIADPRLTGREYGRYIFASLPPLRKTRDEQRVLTFIDNLALEHESISD